MNDAGNGTVKKRGRGLDSTGQVAAEQVATGAEVGLLRLVDGVVHEGELDKQVAGGNTRRVVGRGRRLLDQVEGAVDVPHALLLATDARVRSEHAHDLDHPGGLTGRGALLQLAGELGDDRRRPEALVEEVQLLDDEVIESERQGVRVLRAALGGVVDVEVLVGCLQRLQLGPDSGEEVDALRGHEVAEDILDLQKHHQGRRQGRRAGAS
ncbi:hypothetical protein HYQ46_010644 [Verticillium longisporum]|nr:hypothetical protein HYQ46_010644 [Verticillium longisporum]